MCLQAKITISDHYSLYVGGSRSLINGVDTDRHVHGLVAEAWVPRREMVAKNSVLTIQFRSGRARCR